MKYMNISIIAIIILSTLPAYSSEWGIGLNGGYNVSYGVSEAMTGSEEQFIDDYNWDYNTSAFPFGEEDTKTFNMAMMLNWKPDSSLISYYLGLRLQVFYLDLISDDSGWNIISSYDMLYIMSLAPGVEYTIGERVDLWNTFIKAGINLSLIGGTIEQGLYVVDIPLAFRVGFDLGLGGRINLSPSFSLELSMDYHNCNLIGKSYTKPSAMPPYWLKERELNDAANPNDPDDSNRNIAYFCFGIGFKFWL